MARKLTVGALRREAMVFAKAESLHDESCLFGVTDGKAVGTYLEHKFRHFLAARYTLGLGNTAKGIDLPELDVDIKVTSIRQPQSSCPFSSARQKIFGLGYSLLLFVYEKSDNPRKRTARLNILHAILIEKARTADYQTTMGIRQILKNKGNAEDLVAFMHDRMLPVDDIEANSIAQDLLAKSCEIGYLTISNALQWRLQYMRAIEHAGSIKGIVKIL